MYGQKSYWPSVIVPSSRDVSVEAILEPPPELNWVSQLVRPQTHTHKHTSQHDVKLAPVRRQVWIYVLTSLFVNLKDAVSYLLQHGVLTGQHCEKPLREELC